MTQKPQINLSGVPQHIIQHGNYPDIGSRQRCFYLAQDYQRYLDELKASALKCRCRIHAYVLMPNYVHLLITPMFENGISKMMQALGGSYVNYINATYKRSGTLWQGPFKNSLIDSDISLLACMCYIELDPVRAGLVKHPGEYQWSSYQQNAQMSDTDFIENHQVFSMLGETMKERQFVYRGLFHRYIENDVIHQICDALNHELVPGCSDLREKIEAITKRQTELAKSGRHRVKEENVDCYIYE